MHVSSEGKKLLACAMAIYFKNGSSHGKELAVHDQELVTVFIKAAHPRPCNVNWARSCQPLCI